MFRRLLVAAVGAAAIAAVAPLTAHAITPSHQLCVSANGITAIHQGNTVCDSVPGTAAVAVGTDSFAQAPNFSAVAVSPAAFPGTNAIGQNAPATSMHCTVLNLGGVCVNNTHLPF